MTTQPEAMTEDLSFSPESQRKLDLQTLGSLSHIDRLYARAVRQLTQESEKRDSGEAEDAPLKKQREQILDDAENVVSLSNKARLAYARFVWNEEYVFHPGTPADDFRAIQMALQHQKIQPYQIIPGFNGSKDEAPEAVVERSRANRHFFMVFSEQAAARHGYKIGEVTGANGTRQEIAYTCITDNKNWAKTYRFPDAREAFSAQNQEAANLKVLRQFDGGYDLRPCLADNYKRTSDLNITLPLKASSLGLK